MIACQRCAVQSDEAASALILNGGFASTGSAEGSTRVAASDSLMSVCTLAAWPWCRRGSGHVGSPFISEQVFQTEFELFDLVIEFLRLAAELHAAQLRDGQLQLLDFDGTRRELLAQAGNQRLERIDIVGEIIGAGRHAASLHGAIALNPCL